MFEFTTCLYCDQKIIGGECGCLEPGDTMGNGYDGPDMGVFEGYGECDNEPDIDLQQEYHDLHSGEGDDDFRYDSWQDESDLWGEC